MLRPPHPGARQGGAAGPDIPSELPAPQAARHPRCRQLSRTVSVGYRIRPHRSTASDRPDLQFPSRTLLVFREPVPWCMQKITAMTRLRL